VRSAKLRYGWIAGVYDQLGWLYTGGQMARLKQSQRLGIARGGRALYAGVGTGEELESALSQDAQPTALDASKAMLERARRRLGAAANKVHFCCEDVFAHRPNAPYDVVVANFFLNVFSTARMPHVLTRLCDLLRPGGTLLIGDFSPPAPGRVERTLQRAYYLPPLLSFWLLTGNAWHPLYDYRPVAASLKLRFLSDERVRIFGVGPRWLSTLRFVKDADGH
jgi:demethylmenaquinone methyltransferase/2-methoxy-6-polyprenyl-1,4-benzoquinol methylase